MKFVMKLLLCVVVGLALFSPTYSAQRFIIGVSPQDYYRGMTLRGGMRVDSLYADTLRAGYLVPNASSWKKITVDSISVLHAVRVANNRYVEWVSGSDDTLRLDNNGTKQLRIGFNGGAVGATIWADSMAIGALHTYGSISSNGVISFGQYPSAVRTIAAGGKGIQAYVTVSNDTIEGKTTSAIYGRIHTETKDSIGSQIGCYGRGVIEKLGRLSDNYGGFFVAEQKDDSNNDLKLIGALGYALLSNDDSLTSPQQWIAGVQGMVGGTAGKARAGTLKAGVISHVLYDPMNNTTASAYIAARTGSGTGGTAGAAYRIVQTSTGIHDWTYGVIFPDKNSGYNFSRAEIGAMDGNCNIDGLPIIPRGTIGVADSVLISLDGNARNIMPDFGALVIDTVGTDSLFIFLGSWVFIAAP